MEINGVRFTRAAKDSFEWLTVLHSTAEMAGESTFQNKTEISKFVRVLRYLCARSIFGLCKSQPGNVTGFERIPINR